MFACGQVNGTCRRDITSVGAWLADTPFEEDHAHGVRNLVINPDLLSLMQGFAKRAPLPSRVAVRCIAVCMGCASPVHLVCIAVSGRSEHGARVAVRAE